VNRHELSEQQWQRLAPLLPAERPPKRGRPYHSHRQILNGILWLLATGAPWRDIPERFGPWSTIANRFYRWQRQGVWQHVFLSLLREADQQGQINWTLHFVDGTVIRAHQHAAGVRRPDGDEALGRSRGGFSTKLHLRADRRGKPLVFLITAGQVHEQTMFLSLLQAGGIRTG
jgi:transposase